MNTNSTRFRSYLLAGFALTMAVIAVQWHPSENKDGSKEIGKAALSTGEQQGEEATEQLLLAEQGDAVAQNYIGWAYENGKGVPKDAAKAVEWYRKAAEQGYSHAQYNLGMAYQHGAGLHKDRTKAIEWYQKAAEQGNADAQYSLGWLYQNVVTITKNGTRPWDPVKALEWYRKAAEQGHAGAQNSLGIMYNNGEGIQKDYDKAVSWYQKSADQGNVYAQYNLGLMYRDGEGVYANATQAVEWFRKAAEQGYVDAQMKLGRMYRTGAGIPRDYSKAFDWFLKAACQGEGWAQSDVGEMYLKGEGVSKDIVLAYAWMNLAQSGEHPLYVVPKSGGFAVPLSVSPLERTMSPVELAEAQQLSSNWKKGETLTRIQLSNSAAALGDRQPTKQLAGTAFFVSPQGHAITSNHVVQGCKAVTTEGKGKAFQVLTADTANDLALLQLPERRDDMALLPAQSSKVRQGQEVVVFGFPLNAVLSSGGNLTPGVVSALTGAGNNTGQIQITAPIQPGSSGSPVLDRQGHVVGVVAMKLSDNAMANAMGTLAQNVNFAVSGQTLASFLEAHQVPYEHGRSWFVRDKPLADLADEARKWTVVVECWK